MQNKATLLMLKGAPVSACVVFLPTLTFCQLVGVGHDRFERRRLRERAAVDVAEALGADDTALMPITPLSRGQSGQYDALDAVRLRSVVELERAGMEFGQACRFIRGAGISPIVIFSGDHDTFAAQWLAQDGAVRRVCGSSQELARAAPESPLAATTVNLSAIRGDVVQRAQATLGLIVRGTNFFEGAGR